MSAAGPLVGAVGAALAACVARFAAGFAFAFPVLGAITSVRSDTRWQSLRLCSGLQAGYVGKGAMEESMSTITHVLSNLSDMMMIRMQEHTIMLEAYCYYLIVVILVLIVVRDMFSPL